MVSHAEKMFIHLNLCQDWNFVSTFNLQFSQPDPAHFLALKINFCASRYHKETYMCEPKCLL